MREEKQTLALSRIKQQGLFNVLAKKNHSRSVKKQTKIQYLTAKRFTEERMYLLKRFAY
jgi:hypothetical protein